MTKTMTIVLFDKGKLVTKTISYRQYLKMLFGKGVNHG
jgi:uncharacterized membrane protein